MTLIQNLQVLELSNSNFQLKKYVNFLEKIALDHFRTIGCRNNDEQHHFWFYYINPVGLTDEVA